jgi:hypothetical protein
MSMQTVDTDFQRQLDEFNESQGGPAYIELCWDMRRNVWTVWAIPVDYGTHPLAKNWVTPKLMKPFLDGSGRMGVFLFTWSDPDSTPPGGFMPLDGRLFNALRYADTFRDKHHFDQTITEPELKKEMLLKKETRDIAYGAASYWAGLNRVMVGSNFKGNWRRAAGLYTHA